MGSSRSSSSTGGGAAHRRVSEVRVLRVAVVGLLLLASVGVTYVWVASCGSDSHVLTAVASPPAPSLVARQPAAGSSAAVEATREETASTAATTGSHGAVVRSACPPPPPCPARPVATASTHGGSSTSGSDAGSDSQSDQCDCEASTESAPTSPASSASQPAVSGSASDIPTPDTTTTTTAVNTAHGLPGASEIPRELAIPLSDNRMLLAACGLHSVSLTAPELVAAMRTSKLTVDDSQVVKLGGDSEGSFKATVKVGEVDVPVWVKSSRVSRASDERHTAQIAFFHLDQLLHTNAVVPTVGRVLTQADFMPPYDNVFDVAKSVNNEEKLKNRGSPFYRFIGHMLKPLQTLGDFESLEVSISLFCQGVHGCPRDTGLKSIRDVSTPPAPHSIADLLITRHALVQYVGQLHQRRDRNCFETAWGNMQVHLDSDRSFEQKGRSEKKDAVIFHDMFHACHFPRAMAHVLEGMHGPVSLKRGQARPPLQPPASKRLKASMAAEPLRPKTPHFPTDRDPLPGVDNTMRTLHSILKKCYLANGESLAQIVFDLPE